MNVIKSIENEQEYLFLKRIGVMYEHNSAGLLKYSHNVYGAEFQIYTLYYIGVEEYQLNIWAKDINIYI